VISGVKIIPQLDFGQVSSCLLEHFNCNSVEVALDVEYCADKLVKACQIFDCFAGALFWWAMPLWS
jgi:hypothetical protein